MTDLILNLLFLLIGFILGAAPRGGWGRFHP